MKLFEPIKIGNTVLKNRMVLAPMCLFCVDNQDGVLTPFHQQHYLSRAVGGFGLIIQEMTAIEPDGRISPNDLGLYDRLQVKAAAKLVKDVHALGAKIAIQIGHAGRKATGAGRVVSSSSTPYDGAGYQVPHELSTQEVEEIIDEFVKSANLAVSCGYDMIELHGAHGYLIHQFHSPLTNRRFDRFGSYEQFGVEIIERIKKEIPKRIPVIIRISLREYVQGGYDSSHGLNMLKAYVQAGVDAVHISSGGEGPIPEKLQMNTPGYQLSLAEFCKKNLEVPVIGVGRLEDPVVAEQALDQQMCDLIALGRGALDDPYWPIHTASRYNIKGLQPKPYERAIHK